MARSIWSGVISFGMVSIPVKLYTATESKDVSFHLLHRECSGRLRQLRWCPPCERAVEWEETVRGFEYARDEHVILADGDSAPIAFGWLPIRGDLRERTKGRPEPTNPMYM